MMESKFYEDAANYWAQIPPTVEGVLGGFGCISEVDIKTSKIFLESILGISGGNTSETKNQYNPPDRKLALDCGAGIGRITKFLLVDYFDVVDLVEQNELFLKEARTYINKGEQVGDLYPVGLQNFRPEKKYDIIWCQWVLSHLNDKDLIAFLTICSNALNENGLIFVKENVTSSNRLEKDEVDSSVTRPLNSLLSIFKKCKLKRVKACTQTDFPKGLYPVYMFALQPGNKQNNDCQVKVDNTSNIKPDTKLLENLHNLNIIENQK